MTTTTPEPLLAAPASTPLPRFCFPFGGLLLTLLLLAYTLFLLHNFAPAITEPDDNGYFAQGTLLADTGRTWFTRQSDSQYIGMHWLLTPDDKFISRYPPGLAAIIAGVYKLFGWRTAALVNPLLSVAGLIGLYFAIKQVVGSASKFQQALWALTGVAVLAVNPQYVHHALSGDAHVGVACFLNWGLYFLFRWSVQKKLWQAFVAGLLLGCIPTIRYADGIMAVGIAAFLLFHWRTPRAWMHWLLACAGALIPITPLLIRNQMLMGAFWRTGYTLTNEETGFSWEYFKEHFLPYIQTIHSSGVGLLFALGFVGMIVLLFTRGKRATGAALLLMSVPMLLVYMAYYWAPMANSAMTMRFLLPTFGLYIIAGLWLVQQAAASIGWSGRLTLATALVAVQFLWGMTEMRQSAERLAYVKNEFASVTQALDRISQKGDVVVSSGNFLQQLDFVRKWKVVDQNVYFGGGPGMGPGPFDADSENAPSPRQAAKSAAQRDLYTGSQAEREQKFIADVRRWAEGHTIWVVGAQPMVMQFNGPRCEVAVVSRVKMPAPPADLPPRGGRGGFGRGGPGGGFRGARGRAGPIAGPAMENWPPGGAARGRGPGGGFGSETEIVIAQWKIY